MNNEQRERINKLLFYFRDILARNPNYSLSMDTVYDELVYQGVPKKGELINGNFDKWKKRFATSDKCNVFVSETWKYFCQFVAKDLIAKKASDHIKVYIPLDAEHIEQGANEIFDFLSKENITHLSKIGSHVRFDDIVVRLVYPNDLKKLIQFIHKNKYIRQGLIKANPFACNVDGIALAVDGSLSYNSTIANLIRLYLKEKKNQNDLNSVNVDNFYKFIRDYYEKSFSSSKGLKQLDEDFREEDDEEMDLSRLVNYQNVFELILKAKDKSFSAKDLLSHYTNCITPSIQRAKINKLNETLKSRDKKNADNKYSVVEKKVISDIHHILTVMSRKYGESVARRNLETYILSGDDSYLTRDSGLRDQIHQSTFRSDIKTILRERSVNMSTYLDAVAEVTIEPETIYLEQAIIETYRKYERKYQEGLSDENGLSYAISALRLLDEYGDYHGFTRENNARANLEEHVPAYRVKNIILKELGYDSKPYMTVPTDLLYDYVRDVIDRNQIKTV